MKIFDCKQKTPIFFPENALRVTLHIKYIKKIFAYKEQNCITYRKKLKTPMSTTT